MVVEVVTVVDLAAEEEEAAVEEWVAVEATEVDMMGREVEVEVVVSVAVSEEAAEG